MTVISNSHHMYLNMCDVTTVSGLSRLSGKRKTLKQCYPRRLSKGLFMGAFFIRNSRPVGSLDVLFGGARFSVQLLNNLGIRRAPAK